MEQEIIKIFETVVEETCGEKHNYNIDTKLDIENGVDSLALMNIFIKIEHVYGINIDEHIEEVAKAKTIGDIVELVRRFT